MQFGKTRSFFKEVVTVPAVFQKSYLPSLDGIRALSIIIVIIGHANQQLQKGKGVFYNKTLAEIFGYGSVGVQVFFVLSGFLITTLLIKEKLKTGTISLRNFYIRRALRILPVAYLYLVCVMIIKQGFGAHPAHFAGAIIASLFFVRNLVYRGEDIYYEGHYWSLSVEEQFYLLFPSFIKRSIRTYLVFLLILIVLAFAVKLLNCNFIVAKTNVSLSFWVSFFDNFVPICIGALFSVLVFKNCINLSFLVKYKMVVMLFCIIVYYIVVNNSFRVPALDAIGYWFNHLLLSVLIGICIVANIEESRDVVFRVLNLPVIRSLGILSYSIYIWQQLFIFGDSPWVGVSSLFSNMYVNFSLLLIISYLSYHFYEKRFLKFKDRFKKI